MRWVFVGFIQAARGQVSSSLTCTPSLSVVPAERLGSELIWRCIWLLWMVLQGSESVKHLSCLPLRVPGRGGTVRMLYIKRTSPSKVSNEVLLVSVLLCRLCKLVYWCPSMDRQSSPQCLLQETACPKRTVQNWARSWREAEAW